jgi:hypothetical protein
MNPPLTDEEEQLLDLFACQAMQVSMDKWTESDSAHAKRISEMAYNQAEAMIVERRKRIA